MPAASRHTLSCNHRSSGYARPFKVKGRAFNFEKVPGFRALQPVGAIDVQSAKK